MATVADALPPALAFSTDNCQVGRALAVFGDRRTPLKISRMTTMDWRSPNTARERSTWQLSVENARAGGDASVPAGVVVAMVTC